MRTRTKAIGCLAATFLTVVLLIIPTIPGSNKVPLRLRQLAQDYEAVHHLYRAIALYAADHGAPPASPFGPERALYALKPYVPLVVL